MELPSIIELFQAIPLFIWVFLILVLFILFSDKQLWEYEAKFAYQEGIGSGEIEIEYYKKAKGSIDLELSLDESRQNKSLDIFLDDDKLFSIPAEQNNKSRLHFHEPYHLSEPHEGMIVQIKSASETLFSAALFMD